MCAESESSAASFWRRAVSLEEEEEEEDEGVVAFVAVARFLIVLEVRTALELIKVADDNKGDDVIVEVKEKIEKWREKERDGGIGWLEWQEIWETQFPFSHSSLETIFKMTSLQSTRAAKRTLRKSMAHKLSSLSKSEIKRQCQSQSVSLSLSQLFADSLPSAFLFPQLPSSLSQSLILLRMQKLRASAYTSACNQER